MMAFSAFKDLALFPCEDPRFLTLEAGDIQPVTKPLHQGSAEDLKVGHYMLYHRGTFTVPIA
jgi:hypothetical protein